VNQLLDFDRFPGLHRDVRTDSGQDRRRAVHIVGGQPERIVVHADEEVTEQPVVAAAVSGQRIGGVLDDLRFAPVRLEEDFRNEFRAVSLHLAHAEVVEVLALGAAERTLDHVEFETALGAVEDDAVTFPRAVRAEAVGHHHIVLVADHDAHVVLDADAVAEDALVAVVAVFGLGVVIEPHQVLVIGLHMQRERVLRSDFTAAGPVVELGDSALFGVGLAVELEVAHGEDGHRLGIDPPVHQVEVVGGFVDHQAAGVVLVAVPAAEVVRAVAGVEQPFEMDAGDLADDSGVDDLFDLGVARSVTVVEGDGEVLAGALLGVDDLLAFISIDGHRLFADDVAAELHRAAGVFVMGAVHRGDDDRVGLAFGDHPVEILGRIGCDVGMVVAVLLEHDLVVEFHPLRVGVAESDQLGMVAELVQDGFDVHFRPAAGPDDAVTLFHDKSPGWD